MNENEKKELIEKLKTLDKEKLKELLKEAGIATRRERKEIPEDVKQLLALYESTKATLKAIRDELKAKGYTPRGSSVRRGYGNYDYRGMPIYEKIKEYIKTHGYVTRSNLEEYLRSVGYKWSGTVGVVLKNLKEDGLIVRANDGYKWTGD